MAIYTGTGDRGNTSLFSGERISKNSLRIEACGEIDELNSAIGVVISMLPGNRPDIKDELFNIQSLLFEAGARISTISSPSERKETERKYIDALETAIERMEKQLPTLRGFILPGGHMAGALSHLARTVCRRAERRVVALHEEDQTAPDQLENIMILLNRLSDYLFTLARYINHLQSAPEITWKK